MKKNKPICLYTSLDKDKKSLDKILNSGIKCNFYGPVVIKDSPIVFFNSMTFYGLSGTESFIKQWEKNKFEKLKIKLNEKNERIFREMHQFIKRDCSFEEFINDWIEEELYMNGFE